MTETLRQQLIDRCDGKTVAIVANGSLIRHHQSGKDIDAHDVVVRFSDARNMKWPESAGTRTDVWCCAFRNEDLQRLGLSTFKDVPFLLWLWPDNSYMLNALRPRGVFGTQAERETMQATMTHCPTNGSLAINWFLQNTKCAKLTVYGMDFYAEEKDGYPIHESKSEAAAIRLMMTQHLNATLVEYDVPNVAVTDKSVVVWPFRYDDMTKAWRAQMLWVCAALQARGYTIYQHPQFKTKIPRAVPYEGGMSCDIVIYNHACRRDLITPNPIIKAERTWFFKPTIPDQFTSTLDTHGYGPTLSCTKDEPPYQDVKWAAVQRFYLKHVKRWIEERSTKWGDWPAGNVVDDDYYLVLGQVPSDTVVTTMAFGRYTASLLNIVDELNDVGDRRIIVKLHPSAKGHPECKQDIEGLKAGLSQLGVKVCVEESQVSVHSYFPKARCVFTSNSEAGIEAMFHGKPVVTWGYPQYHWVGYDLRHLSDMTNALDTDSWFDERAAKKWVYWYLRKFCFWDKRSAQRRVDQLLGVTDG